MRRFRVVPGVLAGLLMMGSLAATTPAAAGRTTGAAPDPPMSVPQQKLDAALDCDDFTHPDNEVLLLNPASALPGNVQWDPFMRPHFRERGLDTCTLTSSEDMLRDIQVGAEYIVNAVHRIHERTGRQVATVGFSAGAMAQRWAAKWWPSVHGVIADDISLTGVAHGDIGRTEVYQQIPGGVPAVVWQQATGSNFVAAINRGDETPGPADYTSMYSGLTEVASDAGPNPTSALDLGRGNPKVANISLTDACPGRPVEHVTIALTDSLSFELIVDAAAHDGPGNVERAGGMALCTSLSVAPGPDIVNWLGVGQALPPLAQAITDHEPPLKSYAQG